MEGVWRKYSVGSTRDRGVGRRKAAAGSCYRAENETVGLDLEKWILPAIAPLLSLLQGGLTDWKSSMETSFSSDWSMY